MHSRCISCRALAGAVPPPGGIVYQNDYWAFFLRAQPLLVPGQGFIVLKRHCERLGDLTGAEVQALGPIMQRVAHALDLVLQPARVHFGLYGEAVQHLHLHVLPRMPAMPAGNIPITFLGVWYDVLSRIGFKRPYPDAIVAGVGEQLRHAMREADR